jgi:hypothetical protein
VSSECGIPALIFFVAGLGSSWLRLRTTFRKARKRQDCQDIRAMSMCIMVALAGFTVAAFFLNFAYLFYAPAMGGIAIAVSSSAGREFEMRGATQATPAAPAPIPVPRNWHAAWA